MSVYVVVTGMEAHYARAEAAGAAFISKLHDNEGYPGQSFDTSQSLGIRDPEGNLWHFGSYNPLAAAEP